MSRSHADQLLAPLLTYWRIRFRSKARYAVWLPLAAGAITATTCAMEPGFNVAGDLGLVDSTLSLLALLVGFYIAALGVAVTAGEAYLDEVPEDRPPTVPAPDGGPDPQPISWRKFLAALFAHLVAVSFVTYIFGALILVVAPIQGNLSAHVPVEYRLIPIDLARSLVAGAYTVALCHLFVTTFFGLFLMAERLPEVRDEHIARTTTSLTSQPMVPKKSKQIT